MLTRLFKCFWDTQTCYSFAAICNTKTTQNWLAYVVEHFSLTLHFVYALVVKITFPYTNIEQIARRRVEACFTGFKFTTTHVHRFLEFIRK